MTKVRVDKTATYFHICFETRLIHKLIHTMSPADVVVVVGKDVADGYKKQQQRAGFRV